MKTDLLTGKKCLPFSLEGGVIIAKGNYRLRMIRGYAQLAFKNCAVTPLCGSGLINVHSAIICFVSAVGQRRVIGWQVPVFPFRKKCLFCIIRILLFLMCMILQYFFPNSLEKKGGRDVEKKRNGPVNPIPIGKTDSPKKIRQTFPTGSQDFHSGYEIKKILEKIIPITLELDKVVFFSTMAKDSLGKTKDMDMRSTPNGTKKMKTKKKECLKRKFKTSQRPMSSYFCPACKLEKYQVRHMQSLLGNRGLAKKMLYDYKFRSRKSYGNIFAHLIAKYHSGFFSGHPILLPVSLSWDKWRIRGFCQVSEVVELLQKKYLPNLQVVAPIKRIKSQSQHFRSSVERKEEISQSYIYLDKYKNELSGRRVIIVDDLCTTGATVNHFFSLIKKYNHTVEVDAFFFARSLMDENEI